MPARSNAKLPGKKKRNNSNTTLQVSRLGATSLDRDVRHHVGTANRVVLAEVRVATEMLSENFLEVVNVVEMPALILQEVQVVLVAQTRS